MGQQRSTVAVHACKDQGGGILKRVKPEPSTKAPAGRALHTASGPWSRDFVETWPPATPGSAPAREGPTAPSLSVTRRGGSAKVISGALLAAVCSAAGCATPSDQASAPTTPEASPSLEVSLAHDTPDEEATRAQLSRLVAAYDLRPWFFTQRIAIDETEIPHSHPELTLHTRHLKDDDQLLSTFIHEQLHWFLDSRVERTAAAVAELRAEFPEVPVGFPDGARSEQSSYEHLLVIYFEFEGLKALVGEARANETFRFWEGDHYRALYRMVREHRDAVAAIVTRNELIPAAVRPDAATGSAQTVTPDEDASTLDRSVSTSGHHPRQRRRLHACSTAFQRFSLSPGGSTRA